ncbi:zinc-ribbon domain-containing protein [Haloarcula rubra]|uniref:zinc-ribbon domain-containing protein n=1 Tax=Haloarcula rubra TaxID=2487747 RepID=UPI002E28C2C4|nr:zinc-ribbon domain-containing protein [Halomicroarcula rubra]
MPSVGFFEKAGREVEKFKQTASEAAEDHRTPECPACGESVPDDVEECPECGADLAAEN